MSANSSQQAKLPKLDEQVLERALDELAIADPEKRMRLGRQLKKTAESFAIAPLALAQFPSLHEEVKRAGEMAGEVEQLLEGLDSFQSMQSPPISFLFEEYHQTPGGWKDLRLGLERLRVVLEKMGQARLATRQADIGLKYAVGAMMFLIERETGVRAKVSRRQSDKGKEPELSSPEARAIAILLRAFKPELQTTTLVNVITAISSENRNKSLSEYSSILLLDAKVRPI